MIIIRIVLDDGDDDDHDDDGGGGDAQHAGVIPVNGIPSFPPPVRQPEHAEQAHAYHAHKQPYNKRIKTNALQDSNNNHRQPVNQRSGLICINASASIRRGRQ